jgi:hypothetical protein
VLRCRAVRTLVLTAMNMPMMPESIEQMAPTRNAMPVWMPRSTPNTRVSATVCVSTTEMIAPMTMAPRPARIAMVVYWRLMKAIAPS